MSYKDFDLLNEFLDTFVTDYYLTEDTDLPHRADSAFTIDDTQYVAAFHKATNKNMYILKFGQKKGKVLYLWKFKSPSHVKLALSTLFRIVESASHILPLHGIAIDIPAKADKKYSQLLSLLLKRSYLKQHFTSLPIDNNVETSDQYVFLLKKGKNAAEMFSSSAFKNYDFKKGEAITNDAFDDLKPMKPVKPTLNTAPSSKYSYKDYGINVDQIESSQAIELLSKKSDLVTAEPSIDPAILADYEKRKKEYEKFQQDKKDYVGKLSKSIQEPSKDKIRQAIDYFKAGFFNRIVKGDFQTYFYNATDESYLIKYFDIETGKLKVSSEESFVFVTYNTLIKAPEAGYYNMFSAEREAVKGNQISTFWKTLFGDFVVDTWNNKISVPGKPELTKEQIIPMLAKAVEGYFGIIKKAFDEVKSEFADKHTDMAAIEKEAREEIYNMDEWWTQDYNPGDEVPNWSSGIKAAVYQAIGLPIKIMSTNGKWVEGQFLEKNFESFIKNEVEGKFDLSENSRKSIAKIIESINRPEYPNDNNTVMAYVNNLIAHYAKTFQNNVSYKKQDYFDNKEIAPTLHKNGGASLVRTVTLKDFDFKDFDVKTSDGQGYMEKFFNEQTGTFDDYYEKSGKDHYDNYINGDWKNLYRKDIEKLPSLSAVKRYTESYYTSYNNLLRNFFEAEDKVDYLKWSNHYVNDVSGIMDAFEAVKPTDRDMIVHRKTEIPGWRFEDGITWDLNDNFVDPAIMSTTINPNLGWASNGNVRFSIVLPKGSKVIQILNHSENPGENEIMLPPMSILKPLKINAYQNSNSSKGFFYLHCLYLGSAGRSFINQLKEINSTVTEERMAPRFSTFVVEGKKTSEQNEFDNQKDKNNPGKFESPLANLKTLKNVNRAIKTGKYIVKK